MHKRRYLGQTLKNPIKEQIQREHLQKEKEKKWLEMLVGNQESPVVSIFRWWW